MERYICVLCEQACPESILFFRRVRRGEQLTLSLQLCEGCGARMEKHLKRAIPKRLMEIVPLFQQADPAPDSPTAPPLLPAG